MRASLLLLVLAPLIVCAPAQAEFLLVPSPDRFPLTPQFPQSGPTNHKPTSFAAPKTPHFKVLATRYP
jgi:hypothetical protein